MGDSSDAAQAAAVNIAEVTLGADGSHSADIAEIAAGLETLGVYETKKPENVDSLIQKIDTHWKVLQTYKEHQELPLFFIIDGDGLHHVAQRPHRHQLHAQKNYKNIIKTL